MSISNSASPTPVPQPYVNVTLAPEAPISWSVSKTLNDSTHKQNPHQGETPPWKRIRDILTGYDSKTLRDWQEELANLLTFTGLLSAVVAGFVIYSLPKLEGAIGSAPLATNSSSQREPVSDDNKNISPSDNVVLVNALWMASLTTSLMAAFFTITVQQWLRHIPLPAELSDREAIRLRQFRYDGLLNWRVPTIVALLPIMVQVSVLTFLIGVAILLYPLNTTVFATFVALSGFFLALYSITFPLPLVSTHCSYKTPLGVILWASLHFGMSVIIYSSRSLAHLLKHVPFLRKISTLLQSGSWLQLWSQAEELRNMPTWDLFWTARERKFTKQADHRLETTAILMAANSLQLKEHLDIERCLESCDPTGRFKILLRWINDNVVSFYPSFNHWADSRDMTMLLPLYKHILPERTEIEKQESLEEFQNTLFDILPSLRLRSIDWTMLDRDSVSRFTSILSILYTLATPPPANSNSAVSLVPEGPAPGPLWLLKLAQFLRDIQAGQTETLIVRQRTERQHSAKKTSIEAFAELNPYASLPTTMLLKSYYRALYPVGEGPRVPLLESDTKAAWQWADYVLEAATSSSKLQRMAIYTFQGAIAATGLAFYATRQAIEHKTTIPEDTFQLWINLIKALVSFLGKPEFQDVASTDLLSAAQREDPCGMLYVHQEAIVMISRALEIMSGQESRVYASIHYKDSPPTSALLESPKPWMEDSGAIKIAEHLQAFCGSAKNDADDAEGLPMNYKTAFDAFSKIRNACKSRASPGPAASEPGPSQQSQRGGDIEMGNLNSDHSPSSPMHTRADQRRV